MKTRVVTSVVVVITSLDEKEIMTSFFQRF